MKASVNGAPREVAEGTTVAQLLRELATPRTGLAVAINGSVVRVGLHDTTILADGDTIEIVRAVAGG